MKRLIPLLLLFSAPAWSATCKIAEYQGILGGIPVASEPAIAVQEVTFTTSTQSSEFNAQTRVVRIVCDAKAHFRFGTGPSAVEDNPYLAADTPEYFGISATGLKVAFYDGSS